MIATLRVESPNSAPLYTVSTGKAEMEPTVTPVEVVQRWKDARMFNDCPLNQGLLGLPLEYRVLQIYSRDAGHREAKLGFQLGQGTQDLGFRSDVDILFTCTSATAVRLDIQEVDGLKTMASLLIRDRLGRVYSSQTRRLASDFFFHSQIYR